MKISIELGSILDVSCDLLVVNLFKGVEKLGGATGTVDKALGGAISELISQDKFQGKFGEKLLFPTFGKIKAHKVCVLGLGDRKDFKLDTVRKAGGCLVRIAREAKANKVVTILHGAGVGGLQTDEAAEALAEGLLLGSYEFKYHFGTGRKEEMKSKGPKDVLILETEKSKIKPAMQGLAKADILSRATSFARDLVNTSPRHMTPIELVTAAKTLLGRGTGIKCTVYDREKMERMGMGAALAVAEGSVHPPYAVHLSYSKRKRPKKVIAVVGKGVTFDSGGLSLKPSKSMTTMKCDMSGAAAVLGLFKALSELDLSVEVHGIFIGVENMPSGNAYRPGDVVQAMNGMTIEILDTDAEGRVTLADALSYAVKRVKPDAIIDLATLTGACVVALGEEITGLMSNNSTLTKSVLKASQSAGEDIWELPLPDQYNEPIKSKIADMNNTGGYDAGAIKAGLFLKKFVDNIPWVHLDIAGPAYCEKETRPDTPYGGTGVGVRTLVRYLESL